MILHNETDLSFPSPLQYIQCIYSNSTHIMLSNFKIFECFDVILQIFYSSLRPWGIIAY